MSQTSGYAREVSHESISRREADPRRLRALAHPTRLKLLESLRSDGPATVSLLSERLDVSVASLSYHLRQLGEHGFIDVDETLARDGREKWWRARPEGVTWSAVDFLDSDDRRAAAGALRRTLVERHFELAAGFTDQLDRGQWSDDWAEAAIILDDIVSLTPEDLRHVQAEIVDLLNRRKNVDPAPGARPTIFLLYGFPRASADAPNLS